MLSTKTFLFVILLAHGIGILLFVHGFLLTRIHLKNSSVRNGSLCASPYKKFVWVVIDALRYGGRWGILFGACSRVHLTGHMNVSHNNDNDTVLLCIE